MIANYRVQAELSAIDSTYDGRGIVLGTVDGCVSVLAIADTHKLEMNDYLANLPSRDEKVCTMFSFFIISCVCIQRILNQYIIIAWNEHKKKNM